MVLPATFQGLHQSSVSEHCCRSLLPVFASAAEPGRYERENMVNLMRWQETLYKMFMEKDEGYYVQKRDSNKDGIY